MLHASRENLGYLLTAAARLWSRRLEEAFRDHGYPHVEAAHGAVLVPLFDGERRSISDIMAFSGLSKQTMTSHVAALREQGLIATSPDALDRRRTLLALTPKGRRMKRVADKVVAEVNRDFKASFASSSDYEQLLVLLGTAVGNGATFTERLGRLGRAGRKRAVRE